jgi:hypothetical protein
MNIQFKSLHFSLWNPAVEAVEALKKHRVVASVVGDGSRATINVLVAPKNLDTATLINKVLTKIAQRYSGKNVDLAVNGTQLILDKPSIAKVAKVEKPVAKVAKKAATKKKDKVEDEKPEPKKRGGRKTKELTDEPPVH